MKNKSFKAFLMSTISTVLCISMLIATTLAWFTDTVTSSANSIIAGNLDLAVSYSKTGDGTDWADLHGSDSLFSGSFWEPGHTEVVYLKIENRGTLDLKYLLNVSPIKETGGINVNGNAFMLSDYLVFKTVKMATLTPYTRETARAAAGTETKLNQPALSQSGSIVSGGNAEYVALIVYMPESVGNEANYKTGTTPPEIELGITVIATQVNPSAGFEPYDELLLEQVIQVHESEEVEVDSTGKTTTQTLLSAQKDGSVVGTAIIPAGVQMESGVTRVTLNIVPDTDPSNAPYHAVAGDNQLAIPLNIQLIGISASNTEPITISYFIGKNLMGVTIYHMGVPINNTYDSETGLVTFESATFSPFTVVYNKPVPTVYPEGITADSYPQGKNFLGNDSKYYADLKSAINAGVSTVYVKENSKVKASATGTNRTDYVIADITVYANGADFQHGEVAIKASGSLQDTINITIYSSRNLAVWGEPTASGKTYNVSFYNSANIGTSTNTGQFVMYRTDNPATDAINVTLRNCTLKSIGGLHDNAVHSTSIGSVNIIGCTFDTVGVPVNISLKQDNGIMSVNVQNCTFINCGHIAADESNDYHAPVRLVNTVSPNSVTGTISDNTFIGTVGYNGDIHLGDYRPNKPSEPFSVTVKSKGTTKVYVNGAITTMNDGEAQTFSYTK